MGNGELWKEMVFFFETECFALITQSGGQWHHVGQVGLKLLTSSDLPASAHKVLGLQA